MVAAGAAAMLTHLPAVGGDHSTVEKTPVQVTNFDFQGMKLAVHSYIETLGELPGVGKIAEPLQVGVVYTTWDGEMFSSYAVVKDAYGEMFVAHGMSPDEAVDNISRHVAVFYHGMAIATG